MDTHKYNFKQTNKMEFDLGDIGMLVYALNTLILIPRSDSKQKQKIYLFKKNMLWNKQTENYLVCTGQFETLILQ